MALENKCNIEFENVNFELMGDGSLLITVEWNGEMAKLSRSAILRRIHHPEFSQASNNIEQLIDFLKRIEEENER